MGGFHSLHISKYYPDTFDYIGLFSAAILPNRNPNTEVYQDMDGALRRQMENGYKLYWIGIGRADFLYQNNLQFKEKLEAMGMPHVFVESDGGHIWKNWRAYLSAFVPQLFQ
jgi:enterochelin esterase family protein